MSDPSQRSWPIGTRVNIDHLGEGQILQVRVLAMPRRDLLREGHLHPALEPYADGVLVDVHVGERVILPGAWVDPSVLADGRPAAHEQVRRTDLRFPAVVVGEGDNAELWWGETTWELPLTAAVQVPAACRPALHRRAQLRRLALVALGRRAEVGLSLWQEPAFEIPWHDARLHPRARWWFDIAGIGERRTYRQAAADCGVSVDGLSGQWAED